MRILSRRIDTSVDSALGEVWPAHRYEEHELLWAATERLTVTTPDSFVLVPRGVSVWIPAGTVHMVQVPAGGSPPRFPMSG